MAQTCWWYVSDYKNFGEGKLLENTSEGKPIASHCVWRGTDYRIDFHSLTDQWQVSRKHYSVQLPTLVHAVLSIKRSSFPDLGFLPTHFQYSLQNLALPKCFPWQLQLSTLSSPPKPPVIYCLPLMCLLFIPQGTLMLVFICISCLLNCIVAVQYHRLWLHPQGCRMLPLESLSREFKLPWVNRQTGIKVHSPISALLGTWVNQSNIRHSVVWKGTAGKQERSSMSHCPSVNVWIWLP